MHSMAGAKVSHCQNLLEIQYIYPNILNLFTNFGRWTFIAMHGYDFDLF
jgi:hypothetical protein